jgi:hypothetical protein
VWLGTRLGPTVPHERPTHLIFHVIQQKAAEPHEVLNETRSKTVLYNLILLMIRKIPGRIVLLII